MKRVFFLTGPPIEYHLCQTVKKFWSLKKNSHHLLEEKKFPVSEITYPLILKQTIEKHPVEML